MLLPQLLSLWLLVAGCWLLVVGCWLLAVGCWLLVAGCWLLAFSGLWLVVGCWLLAVCGWLLVVGCWWLVVGGGGGGGGGCRSRRRSSTANEVPAARNTTVAVTRLLLCLRQRGNQPQNKITSGTRTAKLGHIHRSCPNPVAFAGPAKVTALQIRSHNHCSCSVCDVERIRSRVMMINTAPWENEKVFVSMFVYVAAFVASGFGISGVNTHITSPLDTRLDGQNDR